MRTIHALLLPVLLLPLLALAQTGNGDADARRFRDIKAKRDRGEQVTPEERKFAMDYMASQRQGAAKGDPQRSAEYAKANPPRETTGLIPLTELGAETYKGEEGGLYPGGGNTPPPAHLKAGLALAAQIVPLDAEGNAAADGAIVLLTCGMSNTTMESQAFIRLAADDQDVNPRLKIVDGAQGGQTAKVTGDPKANYWKVDDERLAKAGLTAKQVQVVWLKQANARPTGGFPEEAKALEQDVLATLHNLHDRFPNLKLVYVSSRIYGGYAASALNPEPYAYEGAFAYKWLIAGQIAGKPELNYDSVKGPVRAPWIAWGPYLWADGLKAGKDGLLWTRADFGPDGTHPSDSGRAKVAQQLLAFLKSDPTSQPWFLKRTTP